MKLVVTSPPYNLGKPYEKRLRLQDYLAQQETVIKECVRVLHDSGSLCWQVGNYVDNGSIVPLDVALYPIFDKLGLQMRNRIVWRFGYGLHCSLRFSGQHDPLIWFAEPDDHAFALDCVYVPQKCPGKKGVRGQKAGKYSLN